MYVAKGSKHQTSYVSSEYESMYIKSREPASTTGAFSTNLSHKFISSSMRQLVHHPAGKSTGLLPLIEIPTLLNGPQYDGLKNKRQV
jgi:hypothetical protein